MIEGYEVTAPLSQEEMMHLPIIIKALSAKTKDNPVTADEICQGMRPYLKLSGPRVRKIVNYLRGEGLLPVIASSNGYYVSHERKDIEHEIKTLQQRIDAIAYAARGLKNILIKKEVQTEINFNSWKQQSPREMVSAKG